MASLLERVQDGLNRRFDRQVGLFVKIIVPVVVLFTLFSLALGIWVAGSARRSLLERTSERTDKQLTTARYLLESRMQDLAAAIGSPILLQKLSPLITKGIVDLTGDVMLEVAPGMGADFIHAYDARGKFLTSSARIVSYQEPAATASLIAELSREAKGTSFLALLPREVMLFEGLPLPTTVGASGEVLAIVAFAVATDDFSDPIGFLLAVDVLTGDQPMIERLGQLIGADLSLAAGGVVAASTIKDDGVLGKPLPADLTSRLAGEGSAAGTFRIGTQVQDVKSEWLLDRRQQRVGVLSVLNPVEAVLAKSRSLRNGILLAELVLLLLFSAVLGLLLKTLLKTVDKTVAFMESVAAGDLGGQVEVATRDELEVLSVAINRTVANLRNIISEVEKSFGTVEEVASGLLGMAETVSRGANQEEKAIKRLDGATGALSAMADDVAKGMNDMKGAALRNLTALNALSSTVDSVARDAGGFAISSESTGSAIQQSSVSIGQVTSSIVSLTNFLEETSSAMKAVDESTKSIREVSVTASSVSQELYDDAVKRGGEAMTRAKRGMDSIRQLIATLGETVRQAGRKSEEIGEIVDIITEIADQTSLLALNASILAAQAGSEGRGFAVVAEEIRTLSGKTHNSINEISERIRSIQEESRKSVHMVERGIVVVGEGVGEVEQVEQVLTKIIDGATRSRSLSEHIATLTDSQASETAKVSRTLLDISGMATEVAAAMRQQDETGRYIMKLAEDVGAKAETMRVTTDQQSGAVKGIRTGVEETSTVADGLSKRADGVKAEVESLRQTMAALTRVVDENRHGAADFRRSVEALGSQTENVRAKIGAFKLGN